MADRHVRLVDNYFDQSSASQECLPWKANNVSSHLVFSPNETIMHTKSLVCIQVYQYLREDPVFAIVFSHYVREIHLRSTCVCRDWPSAPARMAKGESSLSGSMEMGLDPAFS